LARQSRLCRAISATRVARISFTDDFVMCAAAKIASHLGESNPAVIYDSVPRAATNSKGVNDLDLTAFP
jgi:hypothetical protein